MMKFNKKIIHVMVTDVWFSLSNDKSIFLTAGCSVVLVDKSLKHNYYYRNNNNNHDNNNNNNINNNDNNNMINMMMMVV